MFSHGRSLTSLLVVFFILLFIPVIGPFLAILALAAGGDAMHRSRNTRTYESEQKRLAASAQRKAEWMALSPEDKQKRLAEIERQRPYKN